MGFFHSYEQFATQNQLVNTHSNDHLFVMTN